jgi:hypothetical protein
MSLVLLPLILLGKGYLQVLILLRPLLHKGATSKLELNLYPIDLHPLWLALELVISTKGVQIQRCTICLACITELAQSKNPIRCKMMKLYLECLKDQEKEINS